MRIKRNSRTAGEAGQLGSQIAAAAKGETVEGRVCGIACTRRCPQCGSNECQCKCSPLCSDAPYELSIDSDRHPIEPAVVPLVFEMKRLGALQPCWSCEGHLGPDGNILKLPRVWFYSDSLLHVRLVASGLAKMQQAGRLKARWHIVVTYSDPSNPEPTFSLEPVSPGGGALDLPALQNDLREIASALHTMVAAEARLLENEIRTGA